MGFSLKEYLTGNGARDAQTRRLSLRANALWNSVGSVFYQGCQWLLTVLVVKVSAGYADAGTLAYAMTIGNIFSPIAVYGMRVFQVSDVKNRYSQSAYFGFKYLTMALAAIVSAVLSARSAKMSPSDLDMLPRKDVSPSGVTISVPPGSAALAMSSFSALSIA